MPKSIPMLMLAGLFALHALLPSNLFADYYKYTDKKGVVNITNKLESVPPRYRSTMKVVREAPKKETAAPAPNEAPQATEESASASAAEQQPKQGVFTSLSERFPWFKPLVYVVCIVALFVVVAKLSSLVPSPLLSRLIYVSFFIGVIVFLYKGYVEHVANSSRKIKDTAVSIIKKSSNREEAPPAGDPESPPK